MPGSSPRLLLVDDDPGAILAMRSMLADFPDLRFATCGEDALRSMREVPPDLVILDAQMPGMSGLDVCRSLRADPLLSEIPVIVATAHGSGQIEQDALDVGALHYVTKPLHPESFRARVRAILRGRSPLGAPQPLQPPADPDRPRLLVVDDDASAVHLLRSTLSNFGAISVASNGARALELAREAPPELILLDAHMPGLDGFEVCAALKGDDALHHVPVVFVTRFGDSAAEARALDLGASDFITKPYATAVLKARVRNLLELKRRTDAELHAVASRWRQLADDRIADIVRTASDAILTCDASGRIMLANASAADLLGAGSVELIGQPLERWLGGIESLETMAGLVPVRLQVRREDGSCVPVEASVSRLDDAAGAALTLLLRDMSSRDRLEAESRARVAAEAAKVAKARLMGWLAHEMGNPLNGLLGFMQVVLADATDAPSPTQRRRLELALDSGRMLQRLVGDLLELSRCEDSSLRLERVAVDVTSLVRQALATVEPLALAEGVDLRLEGDGRPLSVLADPQRLSQCLANLLTNGVKYNRRGGQVSARLVAGQASVCIEVADNGIGMDEAQLKHLFVPFNRLGRQHSRIAGTGLGLLITRHLVNAMGGQLHVESRVGSGTRFTIELPAGTEPA